jgi:hypothetical protein
MQIGSNNAYIKYWSHNYSLVKESLVYESICRTYNFASLIDSLKITN